MTHKGPGNFYTVYYRESPEDLPWTKSETFANKDQADRRAYEIYTNGGIILDAPDALPSAQQEPSSYDDHDPENPDA